MMGFFDHLPNVQESWKPLELVHIYFECLRHTLLAWSCTPKSVENYYGFIPSIQEPVRSRFVFLTKPIAKKDNEKEKSTDRETYLDVGKHFRFAPHHLPLSDEPKELKDKDALWSFFADRRGACLAPKDQKGFDSALWTMKVDEYGRAEHPILFLYENKFSHQTTNDPMLKTSHLSKKVSLVQKVIQEYNESQVGEDIQERDVILVFVLLRRLPRAKGPIDSNFEGTVLVLQKEFLVHHFYRSVMPFFEISDTFLANYPPSGGIPPATPAAVGTHNDTNTQPRTGV